MASFFRICIRPPERRHTRFAGFLLTTVLLYPLQAAEKWVELDSGPFRVISPNGRDNAQIRLGELEQFRYAFGLVTGVKDPQLVWPLKLVLSRKDFQAPALSRDAIVASVPESSPLPPEFLEKLTALFIGDNLKRLPPGFDAGLVALFSTLESKGTHIRIGTPPAEPSARSAGWGLLQMLVTDENTRGEVRVFLYNLQQGASMDSACRGAFQKPYAEIQARLDRYLKAGSFPAAEFSGAAISPKRDFRADALDQNDAGLLRADMALGSGRADAGALYQSQHGPESDAGAGLAALAREDKAGARKSFEAAIAQGAKSARAYLEMGILETDVSKKHAYLTRAIELNPRWAEPHYQMALAAKNPANQVAALRLAVSLAPRNLEWWRKLAQAATAAGDFPEAAKAWTGASLAAHDDSERAQILKARADMEHQRSDALDAERKRQAEEEARELERVKQQTLSEIRAAENKANDALNRDDSAPLSNPVPYSELDRQGSKFEGVAIHLDCRTKFSILSVRGEDGRVSKFVVGDLSSLSTGHGGSVLSCGPQKSPRRIVLEYQPRNDRRLGIIGEVRTIQFP
jgi:hypothetical protein